MTRRSLGEEETTQTRTVGGGVFGIILEAPLSAVAGARG